MDRSFLAAAIADKQAHLHYLARCRVARTTRVAPVENTNGRATERQRSSCLLIGRVRMNGAGGLRLCYRWGLSSRLWGPMTADDIIEMLHLQPHPEGGYYRQSYRARDLLSPVGLPDRYDGARAASTAIYFLLRDAEVSHLHRLKSDEVWHFYAGDPLVVHVLTPEGERIDRVLGNDLAAGQSPQFVVPQGAWFGAAMRDDRGFALVGNTVAPGFDFDDFELADRASLTAAWPHHVDLIHRLT